MIDLTKIERDIEHAIKMRHHHADQYKLWKQEVYRLRTDLERAKRINQSNEA
jgi:hypothetical protein